MNFNNIKQRTNRPLAASRVKLYLRFHHFFLFSIQNSGPHTRNSYKYGEERIHRFCLVNVGPLPRQDHCQLDVSAFLSHAFPFIKIKNRSFSNLMDKHMSGGGVVDEKFLALF